jgi:hypothetical protein
MLFCKQNTLHFISYFKRVLWDIVEKIFKKHTEYNNISCICCLFILHMYYISLFLKDLPQFSLQSLNEFVLLYDMTSNVQGVTNEWSSQWLHIYFRRKINIHTIYFINNCHWMWLLFLVWNKQQSSDGVYNNHIGNKQQWYMLYITLSYLQKQ